MNRNIENDEELNDKEFLVFFPRLLWPRLYGHHPFVNDTDRYSRYRQTTPFNVPVKKERKKMKGKRKINK